MMQGQDEKHFTQGKVFWIVSFHVQPLNKEMILSLETDTWSEMGKHYTQSN